MPATLSTPHRVNEPARLLRSEYTMTSRELMAAAAARERFRYSRMVSAVIAILAAPMAFICLCGVVILCRADHNEFTPMFLAMYALGLLVSLVLLLRRPLFVLLNLCRRELRQTRGQTVVVELSTNGVASASLGTDATLPWRAFHHSGCTRRGLILNLQKNLFLWVPASSLPSPQDWETVRDMARTRLPRRS